MEKWAWLSYDRDVSDYVFNKKLKLLAENRFKGVIVSTDNHKFLTRMIKLGKKLNLEVHAWFWTLNVNNDKFVQANYPEWFSKNKLGESSLTNPPYVDYYKWLCPSKQEVKEYINLKVKSILNEFDVDGIHLDYIRYPDVILPKNLQPKYNLVQDKEMPQFDYCYCETCQKKFGEKFGYNPLNIKNDKEQNDWNEYRFEQLTDLVNSLARTVKSYDKQISAAVFPTVEMSKEMVRQDWSKWNIDKFFPMIYHNFYNKDIDWFDEVIKENIKYVDKNKIFPGIYIDAIDRNDFVKMQEILKKNEINGFSIFNFMSLPNSYFDFII